MKNTLLIIPVLLLLIACNTNSNISEPTIEEVNYLKPYGDEISKDLMVSLQIELKKAIKAGGISEAIDVCNLKAIPLTEIVAKSTEMNVDIKRTTFKYRNELNAPDEYEEVALNHYHSKINKEEELPPFYIQKIEINKKTEYYYYKPLVVKPICLNCHGTDEFISAETKSLIAQFYPEDKAIDYNDGDFRGLIRIKFPDYK